MLEWILMLNRYIPLPIWDDRSECPNKQTSFVFQMHMNDVYVKTFNEQSFNQDGNECAISKIKYYNASKLIFQHIAIKEKVGKL